MDGGGRVDRSDDLHSGCPVNLAVEAADLRHLCYTWQRKRQVLSRFRKAAFSWSAGGAGENPIRAVADGFTHVVTRVYSLTDLDRSSGAAMPQRSGRILPAELLSHSRRRIW